MTSFVSHNKGTLTFDRIDSSKNQTKGGIPHPASLSTAIAEAEKAEIDDDKKDDIAELRMFILDNQEAIRGYRERL